VVRPDFKTVALGAGVTLLVASLLGARLWLHRTPTATDLVKIANSQLRACPDSKAPALPDGNTASLDHMLAAREAFKAYDSATDSYIKCVDGVIERIASQYAHKASPADLQSVNRFGTRTHNEAVDREQALADQLNAQIRLYKTLHPQ
jgi:hypothetical protein